MPSTIFEGQFTVADQNKGLTIIVIPARMDSDRLPGKPLLPIGGKPMVRWVYDTAKKTSADYVFITTPDKEVAEYCQENGLSWMPSNKTIPTGTHRVADIASRFMSELKVDFVVNLQADEYEITSQSIDSLISFGWRNKFDFDVFTIVAREGQKVTERADPNVVKAVVSTSNQVFWFSRTTIPGSLLHCGVYMYSKKTLLQMKDIPLTYLSELESLEQLTFLESGFKYGAMVIEQLPRSLNTEDDYKLIAC